ncbi:MAG: oxidative damage protection protein [Arsenophonus sp.]|nr:MAG: oxidative damage protection protein [Arsenophonus sp.]
MNKIIFCKFFKKNSEQLDFPPYPTKLGEKIFNEISKQAWKKWLKKQTVIINEKKLNTTNTQDKSILEREMINFLFKKNIKNF